MKLSAVLVLLVFSVSAFAEKDIAVDQDFWSDSKHHEEAIAERQIENLPESFADESFESEVVKAENLENLSTSQLLRRTR